MTTEELEIWKKLNECECVKKVFEKWIYGDLYLHNGSQGMFTSRYINTVFMDSDDLWIPPLLDPIRPERRLIGIYTINETKSYERLRVFRDLSDDLIKKMVLFKLKKIITLDRPDLALAKAIIEQEGK